MCEVIRIVHLRPGARPDGAVATRIRKAAADAGAIESLVRAPLPGSINAGDLMVRLRFADGASREAGRSSLDAVLAGPDVERFHGAGFRAEAYGNAAGAADASCYRVLLLRVDPAAGSSEVGRLEKDLLAMPRYMPSIRSWNLSRVESAVGGTAWTHVWEQRFASPADVTGQYLDHPVHWAVVDRWFDPECPESIIRDRVCHAFCAISR